MKMLGKDFDEGDIRRAIDWLFAEVDGEIFCGCGLSGVHGGGLDDERPLLRTRFYSNGINHFSFRAAT